MLYFIKDKLMRDRIAKFGLCENMRHPAYTQIRDAWFMEQIVWQSSEVAKIKLVSYFFEAEDKLLEIRVNNDAPAEDYYTLLIDQKAIFSFSHWPEVWEYE